MKNCSGTDIANSASEPDWWGQLERQMHEVDSTLFEMQDLSLIEAFGIFDEIIQDRKRAAIALDQVD